ncbi:MAG: hypothetical protein COA63_000470 [Methylophaga sp.]|nr:hypothetical protein [Methylophaga sp.]
MKLILTLCMLTLGYAVASENPHLGPITAIGPSYMAEKIHLGETFELPLIIGAKVAFWSSSKQDRQRMSLTLVAMTRQEILVVDNDSDEMTINEEHPNISSAEALSFEFEIANESNKERGKILILIGNYEGEDIEESRISRLGKDIIYRELLLEPGKNSMLLEIQ